VDGRQGWRGKEAILTAKKIRKEVGTLRESPGLPGLSDNNLAKRFFNFFSWR
jgi:hypothetical protein